MKFLQPVYEGCFDFGPTPPPSAAMRRWEMRQNRHYDEQRWWRRFFG